MKKLILAILLFLISICAVKAQSWQWAKKCTGAEEGYSVSTDASGNIFITGVYFGQMIVGSDTLNSGLSTDSYLIKYNSNGNVLWAKSSKTTPLQTSNVIAVSVSADANGNSFITGYFDTIAVFGTDTLFCLTYNSMFLVKYNSNGNVLWARSPISTGDSDASSVSTDNAGNIYVTGSFNGPYIVFGTDTLNQNGFFLVKYGPNGNVIWAKKIDGATRGVSSDTNGNAFVTGLFNGLLILGTDTLINNPNPNGNTIFLAKYAPNGNILWARKANGVGSYDDQPYSVSADVNGDVYIIGTYSSSPLAFGTQTIGGTSKNFFLAKYNSNGTALWARSSVSTNTVSNWVNSWSASAYSSGVFISGSMSLINPNDTLIIGSYTLTPPPLSLDPAFIAQYDSNGNVLYAEALYSGGDDNNAVCVDKFCNVYLTGDFSPEIAFGTYSLTTASGESTFLAKRSFTSNNCQSPESISEISFFNFEAKLFPNPNSGHFNIQIDSDIVGLKLIVLNSLGQEIFTQKLINGTNEINAREILKGLYYYSILQNNQTLKTGKISVE